MKKLLIISILFLYFQPSFSQNKTNKTIEVSGDALLLVIPAATIGTTLVLGDKKGTWQFTKGFLVNGAVSFGLKSIIDKQRPNMENDNSFPSAHTSIAFQSASFIQKRYGWKYGIPAYVLAGYTGYTRLDADKHDIVDVLVGAAIGIGSTYIFTTPYQQEHMELTYSTKDGNYLIGFTFKF